MKRQTANILLLTVIILLCGMFIDGNVPPAEAKDDAVSTSRNCIKQTEFSKENLKTRIESENSKITVSSDINIYIEDESGRRSGYDWENDTTYEEIPGAEVSSSSAVLPDDLSFYAWLNKPSSTSKKAATFDAVINAPGRVLKLTNIAESYTYPNFVYEPATSDSGLEFFEILAAPKEMPGIDFTISDDYGEYNFNFTVSYKVDGKRVSIPDAFVDFIIYHSYDAGDIGIAIFPADDSELELFGAGEFFIEGSFALSDDQGQLDAAFQEPLEMAANGMFLFNYLDWQETGTLSLEADLDGDDEWEKEWTL